MSEELAVTADPRVLPRERCVTRYLLDDFAQAQPQKEFAVFQDGDSWSYEAVRNKVRALAAGFAKQGVAQGDHVAVWMFDSKEAILTFFCDQLLGRGFCSSEYRI
jgi:crotonobetaine/carnitine-CoA ligase